MSRPLGLRRGALPGPPTLELTEDLLRVVQLALDVVNSRDPSGARELIGDLGAVRLIVSDHPWPVPEATESDVEALRGLRDRLTGVVADPGQGVRVLAELLTVHPPTFTLATAVDGTPALVIGTPSGRLVDTLAAQMSVALSAFFRDGGAVRIGECGGPGCANLALVREHAPGFCSPYCRTRAAAPASAPLAHRRPPTAARGRRRP